MNKSKVPEGAEPEPGLEQAHSVAFLLEEYKHVAESFRINEDRGQQQVTLYLTLVAIVVTALASGRLYVWVSGAAMGAVLLVGSIVLLRLIKRNVQSDEYLRGLGKIRKYFVGREAGVLPYLPYPPMDHKPMRHKRWKELLSLSDLGLAEIVQLINSIAFAILAAFVCLSFFPAARFRYLVLTLILGFIFAWVVQFAYVLWRYRSAKRAYERRLGAAD